MVELPPELLSQIFLELVQDRQALLSCSSVSYGWRETALPVLMRHVVITYDHLNDRSMHVRDWPFAPQDNWKHVRILEFTSGQDHVDVNLDALRNVLLEFPALDELRLAHVVIPSEPIPSQTSVPHRIRSLTLWTKGHWFDEVNCRDVYDDHIVGIFPDVYDRSLGLPMFSTLSAILSVVVPDVLTLMGGYVRTSHDPPNSVPAPMSVKIRRLSIGKRWFSLSYWRNLLQPNTLEHLTVALAWGDHKRVVRLRTLLEYAGSAVTTLELRMDRVPRFPDAGGWIVL